MCRHVCNLIVFISYHEDMSREPTQTLLRHFSLPAWAHETTDLVEDVLL
jgi:hypothetical protein